MELILEIIPELMLGSEQMKSGLCCSSSTSPTDPCHRRIALWIVVAPGELGVSSDCAGAESTRHLELHQLSRGSLFRWRRQGN